MSTEPFEAPTQSEIDFMQSLETWVHAKLNLESIDNRMLLWLLKECLLNKITDELDGLSYQAALVDELEDRLYPEYDGEKVMMTDWGWQTPEGDLVYNQQVYKKAKAI
jgi:hypothetical protein